MSAGLACGLIYPNSTWGFLWSLLEVLLERLLVNFRASYHSVLSCLSVSKQTLWQEDWTEDWTVSLTIGWKKWRSSRVDIKIKVGGRITPIRVTIIVYRDDENNNVLCKCWFQIATEFQYRCFKCTHYMVLCVHTARLFNSNRIS